MGYQFFNKKLSEVRFVLQICCRRYIKDSIDRFTNYDHKKYQSFFKLISVYTLDVNCRKIYHERYWYVTWQIFLKMGNAVGEESYGSQWDESSYFVLYLGQLTKTSARMSFIMKEKI